MGHRSGIPAVIGRIVEIAQDGRHLARERGFLTINANSAELGRVPLDDLAAVIANAHGVTYTNNLLVALSERGIPMVISGTNHSPAGVLWPVDAHHLQAARIDAQIACKQPVRKRLWADIVRAKIRHQIAVLDALGGVSLPLHMLIPKVRSGDPANVEAQAARVYWLKLFGTDFLRDRDDNGVNSFLNYGYTVLRAATARAVMAAGLHPSIGLHHSNKLNAMRLVDDLMEPFRPFVDLRVYALAQAGHEHINPFTKRSLVEALLVDLNTDWGTSPVGVCIQRLATSLALILTKERKSLDLPNPYAPAELLTLAN